ncbi:Gfo/Idh/MocA family protein [Lunatimonas salinarum]|uniref:Gfo/Idh/MocA family protein n=1 Tax=Lunatimonas salinarum TaxID=1774590 RepID=UPI001AE0C926|nr:Gfo/Idh/MocA family oxidoreductase [Lunatimonas salinarum]
MDFNQAPVLPKNKKPIVIIGAGGIVADAHLPAYRKAGFEVLGIYDRLPEKAGKLATQYNIPNVCTSLDDLLRLGLENQCVYDIALPASTIINVLEKLPHGSGVLIQKPMGETIGEAQEILQLCRKNGLIAGINFQLRHAPYILMAKQLIDQGTIGDLHDIDVRVNTLTPWHLWDFLFDIPRMEILYNSIHYIDMIRYFLGNPNRVMAKTTKHPNMPRLANTRSSIILDYGEYIRANINTNHGHDFGTKHQESFFKFEGTRGAIKITAGLNLNYPKGLPDAFEYISLDDDQGWQSHPCKGSWFPDAFIGPMTGLMCKLEDSSFQYINSVEDAIHTMVVVEKCYLSSAGKLP